MVISESMIGTKSESAYQKTTVQNLRLIGGNVSSQTPAAKNQTGSADMQLFTLHRENFDQVIFTETKNSQFSLLDDKLSGSKTNYAGKAEESTPLSVDELKETLMKRMMEALTGKRFEFRELRQTMQKMSSQSMSMTGFSIGSRQMPTRLSNASLSLSAAEVETQSVSYNATGVVKTADGKTINLDISMAMSQSTATYMEANFALAQNTKPIDPLIINYGGTAASLTEEKFEFDLDADGELDRISFAGEGSGFLALDKNGDGIINDGNELFGPQTNNGFEELRKYDGDGNGWIDEADEVYSKLKIWSKDKDGNDVLYSLKELDIGAIYLNDSKTDYTMYDASGNAQGAMRSTSFYLKDSGGAGFVSHFDLFA